MYDTVTGQEDIPCPECGGETTGTVLSVSSVPNETIGTVPTVSKVDQILAAE